MTERAVPFYCPYCGDEDLEPYETDGGWHCRACTRAFRLRFIGMGALSTTTALIGETGTRKEASR